MLDWAGLDELKTYQLQLNSIKNSK